MAVPNPHLAELSDDDRQVVESWLIAFDQGWDEGILASRVELIPASSSWRLPALVEMVKIDLERQWQHGRRVSLESYLQQFPELGRPENVSVDLIQAEYQVRREFGSPAALDDYVHRFPHHAAELARLIDRGDSSLPGNEPRRASPRLPATFGRYTIIRRLGQGGMGSVYLAEDTHLGRRVALKVPDFGLHEPTDARKRFLAEARAAATLDHPSLCPVFDAGEIDGRLYLTMAYIPGQSLAALIGALGWPEGQAADLVGKLALAMQEAHAKKVIHRDLKPANVMIKTTGPRREPVIVDFGLAHRDDSEEQRLSRSGQIMGTPAYMAPEQIRGNLEEIGPACDIHALGVILYELLTGRLPFRGTGLAVAGQILTEMPLVPSTHRSGLDPALEAICLKAMAKAPGDRYTSMAELAAALTGFPRSPAATPAPAMPADSSGPVSAIAGEPPQWAESNSLVGPFLDQLAGDKSSPRSIPTLEQVASPRLSPAPRRPGPAVTVASAVLGVLLLGLVIVYVTTNNGRIKIIVDDPNAVVEVDGEKIRIQALGEPISLRSGVHALVVKWGDGEFETRSFVLRRGDNEDLRVEYKPTRDPTAPASPETFTEAAPKPGTGSDSTAPPKQITNSIGMKLVLIPAGEFVMGSPDSDMEARADEKPQHRVRITMPFYLGATELTVGQFRRFVERTGYRTEAEADGKGATGWSTQGKWERDPNLIWRHPGFVPTDDHPMTCVSWNDAIAFCNTLSGSEGLKPCYASGTGELLSGGDGYRLPTEAEWEYACRAGSATIYGFGDDAASLGEYASYLGSSDGRTLPTGRFRPNSFGLYDMQGNVWEFCWDRYDFNYYRRSPGADPLGPSQPAHRVARGGALDCRQHECRPAVRRLMQRGHRDFGTGFRVARNHSELTRNN